MNSICDYCLNYEPKKKNETNKTRETCSQACFRIDDNTQEMVCKNFTLVICPDIPSSVVERFLKQDMNFYDNLCDLASIILTMFSYQTIFKVVFDIENGNVELIDMTNSGNTYGKFNIDLIELQKGFVSFNASNEFKQLILGVVEPDSLIFIEFKDFNYKYPIKGVFLKPNYFINRERITLKMQSFVGQEVW